MRTDIDEQDALFQDMLISVSSFFRDPKTFQALTETVFPSILEHKNPDAPIRMWIAGCSTGEEVYSIAICLKEFLGENSDSYRDRTKIQIFASDISDKAIKKARAAIYTKAEVEKVSDNRLKKYFVKSNGEARRALKGNAVSVNKEKVDVNYKITDKDLINKRYVILNNGKKKTYILKVK
jgi:two-component system CheB/CheR fusion protein